MVKKYYKLGAVTFFLDDSLCITKLISISGRKAKKIFSWQKLRVDKWSRVDVVLSVVKPGEVLNQDVSPH